MGSLSIWHWLVVIGVGVLLFGGKGKISSVMGDFAKGIKAFKSGMKEPEEEAVATPPAQVTPPGSATSTAGAAASTASVGVGDRPRDHA
jgi:sec-independent protein translocase protein TatA